MITIQEYIEKIGVKKEYNSFFNEGEFNLKQSYDTKGNTLFLYMQLKELLPFEVYKSLVSKSKLYFKCNVDIKIVYVSNNYSQVDVNNYVNEIIGKEPLYSIFSKTLMIFNGDELVFNFNSIEDLNEASSLIIKFEKVLAYYGIIYKVIVKKFIKENKEAKVVKPVENVNRVSQNIEPTKSFYKEKKKSYSQYLYVPMNELNEELTDIYIVGKVFDIDNRVTRTGLLFQKFYIHDENGAAIVKRREGRGISKQDLQSLKIGDYIAVYGAYTYDDYERENNFKAQTIESREEPLRIDDSSEKRVELHIHTKMSEMDGINDIEDYINCANKWGMDAIAITDHLGVQAYPKAQRCVSNINKNRETPFKMIYGVEMNLVENYLTIVRNANDTLLSENRYVVFDLETSGLSCRHDHIIEFAGFLIENREIVKKMQMFIKAPVKLSAFTTELTNIKQSDIDNARSIEECIDEIMAFVKDSVLVAHNATFDVGFINEVLKRNGKEEITNPIIDTLHLAYSLYPTRKAYRLGALARMFGITYDDGAHRADYDTNVLTSVFLYMLNDLKEVNTLNELAKFQRENCFNKVMKKHITLLAKNPHGLKEIFELVSLSHTKYLAYNDKNATKLVAEPRIIRDEIKKRAINKNILVGTSCVNGEIFDIAHTGSKEKLIKALEFYDYVEIQPLQCYKHLVDRNSVNTMEDVKRIINDIIEAAEETNKIIVATGDVHYVHPKDKIIREIYINTPAIGGIRHPLYIRNEYKRKNTENGDQHFLTTREMLNAFEYLGEDKAYEYVVSNTCKIKDMIEQVYPIKDRLYPPDIAGSDEKLRTLCYENAHNIYGEVLPEIVEERLKRELDSIIGHGFYVVYYISHLLVKKSLNDGYLVGSRGSVGSSFVATMSEITEVNPLLPHYVCKNCHYTKWYTDGSVASGFDLPDILCPNCNETIRGDGQDIPFETFLGFEGDKVPDIDLNFSGDYQSIAHNYTKEVFGDDHVFRAGTIGTVAKKTAYGYVKKYEEEMGIEGSLNRAMESFLSNESEGVKRTTGQHPGGIIVIPLDKDVHDFTPVQFPANNPNADWLTTHFEFHDIHDNVLKLDILGHVDPTAMKLLEEMSGIDVTKIPMNDPLTMSIFNSVNNLNIDSTKNNESTGAAGIPEFGTSFVRGILELTKPSTFDELVKISGLSHGTDVWLGNAKNLIDAGICTLKSVIGCRDDIMVYLLHKGLEPKLAFTIMESVRKGKGLKEEWIPIMKDNGVEDWYIDSCNKIKYMFPKAHAVAYVIMAVRIAWFKVHKPLYFYCMFFSIRCDAYDIDVMIKGEESIRNKMAIILRKMDGKDSEELTNKEKDIYSTLELALEMYLRGYSFSTLDLMLSTADTFILHPDKENTILPPFTSIDGLGVNVANSVVEARNQGAFISKEDLLKRTSLSSTHIKNLEDLGVLDSLQDENQMSLF